MNKEAAQFIEAVSRYKAILIYIPGSPDPDAIASAYAIKQILKYHGIDSDIFAEKKLSLPQNQDFIDRLNIPLIFDKQLRLDKYEAYIVPDFQSNKIEEVSDKLPCVAHIDHHGESKEMVDADFSLIRPDAGSTSTLVTLFLKYLELDFPDRDLAIMATALVFGIQTDTDRYNHIGRLDVEALNYLSDLADRNILKSINSIPPSPEMLMLYNQMRDKENVYKDWAFYGLGYIDAGYRDYIALAADMILKSSGYSTVAVFAVIENHAKGEMYLDVSLRTRSRTVDLNRIIKGITSNGGGRQYKGAYQVNLDYFLHTPEREKLWQVIEATTLNTLRSSRDTLYRAGIENLYANIKEKFQSLLRKK